MATAIESLTQQSAPPRIPPPGTAVATGDADDGAFTIPAGRRYIAVLLPEGESGGEAQIRARGISAHDAVIICARVGLALFDGAAGS